MGGDRRRRRRRWRITRNAAAAGLIAGARSDVDDDGIGDDTIDAEMTSRSRMEDGAVDDVAIISFVLVFVNDDIDDDDDDDDIDDAPTLLSSS
jgi:hypothetical protein